MNVLYLLTQEPAIIEYPELQLKHRDAPQLAQLLVYNDVHAIKKKIVR